MEDRWLYAGACVLALVVAVACAPGGAGLDTQDTWIGSVTTEGKVTTVVNESGSLWGGVATLVEEASIGVEEGDDAYMFGRIDSLWATEEEIFVLDSQVPAIRVFDHDGGYLRDVGSAGQGPGEYARLFSIGVDDEGRMFVPDPRNGRITIFSTDGDLLESWSVGRIWCCIHPMVVTPDGTPYLQVIDPEADLESVDDYSLRAFGPEGAYGPLLQTPDLDVPEHRFRFQDRRPVAPFAPAVTWALARTGEIITGASHEYRFEIRRPDGIVTIVERRYDPVAIDPEEKDWWRRYMIAIFRRGEPGWTWDGSGMPEVKPAFTRLWPTAGGDIWAIRPGPGRRLPQCDPNADVNDHAAFQAASCWRDREIVDVFAPDGRFRGELQVPDGVDLRLALPWVSGDTMIASFYDESGTIMVKRYRLVSPRNP